MSARHDALLSQLGLPATLRVVLSPEVRAEVARHPPGTPPHVACARVVALESTIVAHGMPYPQNVACAAAVEQIVRDAGAVPATVAVLGGAVHIGLAAPELERLAALGPRCPKCSRRDVPLLLARGADGATTVSATVLLAAMAGVSVMATGGIGGVHRGGERSMDVSADLPELGGTRMLVVCAGVKSILDIPRTLEVLETQGVAVIGYRTSEFPAFFTRSSGCPAPLSVDSAAEAARYVAALHRLRLRGGGVLAVPLPAAAEADAAVVGAAIDRSLADAADRGVAGRDATPFLLRRVSELSGGASLAANIALVKNNARVAGEVAVAFAAIAAEC